MTIKLRPGCELAKAIDELILVARYSHAEARAHLLEVIRRGHERAARYRHTEDGFYVQPDGAMLHYSTVREVANEIMGAVSDES